MRKFFISLFGLFAFFSCSPKGETTVTLLHLKELLQDCPRWENREVLLQLTYMGWNCPKDCSHPGITRSDACWVEGHRCIYSAGTGLLNPLKDVGKTVTVKARVKRNLRGVCYLVVEEVRPQ